MKKLLSLLALGFVFLPMVSFAGIVIAPPNAGVKTTIEVCQVGPHFSANNELLAGTNCTSLEVTVTEDKQYVTADGALYRSDCAEPPPSSGLSLTPAACNYVANGHQENTSAPAETPSRGLVPCGGTGQEPCQTCDVVNLTNNVVGWLVLILGTIAAIIIIYAGIKLVTSGGNQHAMEEAKSMMTNLLIGYLIVLSAWLVIDYGLKALLAPDSKFGTWNAIECVAQPVPDKFSVWSNPDNALSGVNGWHGATTGAYGTAEATCDYVQGPGAAGTFLYNCSAQKAQCLAKVGVPTVSAAGDSVICSPGIGGTVDASGLGQCNPGNSACSVSALQTAGLTAQQANIMSCIAMTESSGQPGTRPYNEANPGSNSSACGTFQVVRTTWNGTATGGCSSFNSCTDGKCNLEVAVTLVKQSNYSSWTCKDCNAKANGCIVKYGSVSN